jgi:exopolyphosphatase/guanosine-5'-triphosphate,3'-diphosphate pyrophosphatase
MKAVIDIGTNTFHLLIGEVKDSKTEIIFKQTIAVKLGEGGGISRGEIIPTAYQRGLDAMAVFDKEIRKRNITPVKATATAAVRDAKNGSNFIEDIYQLTQINIDIIDGLQEAFYIYQGAKASGVLSQDKTLLMDIGGGSVEFIICNDQEIFWKNSFRLGAARLLSDFYNNPLTAADLNLLDQHFVETLPLLLAALKEYQPKVLIGTAGAFDSYRDMILPQSDTSNDPIIFDLEQPGFSDLLEKIIHSTHEERLQIKGLIPLRTDMILMASVLTRFILLTSGISEVKACAYSLKEGLLHSI